MRFIKAGMLMTCLIILLSPGPSGAIDIPIGSKAPDFSLPAIGGNKISLSSFRDTVIILIYWRHDQARSLMAVQDAQDILLRFKDRNVRVIGIIAQDDNVGNAIKMLPAKNVQFPVLIDLGRQVYGAYGIHVYPSTVIISRDGKVAYALPGHALNYKKVVETNVQYILGDIDEQKMHALTSPQKKLEDESALAAHRLYYLALKFMNEGFLDMAIETGKKSIEADNDFEQSHILLGFLYLEEKETAQAHKEFREALRLNPQAHDAKTGLGAVLVLTGELDRALEILNDAVEGNPYPEMTYYEIGRAYEMKGNRERAEEMYKRALDNIVHQQILPSRVARCR